MLHDFNPLTQPLLDVPGRHALVLSFSIRPSKSIPYLGISTCDFLGFGSIPGWVTTILEENLSAHALQHHSFSVNANFGPRRLLMKKVFFAAEDILFRNSANFCSEMERQTLPFLAFLFLFPLHNFCRCEEQATYGVESTFIFFFPGGKSC